MSFPTRHIIRGLAVVTLVASGIVYGYLCNSRRLPGYTPLRRLHLWAEQQTVLRAAYNRATGRGNTEQPGPWQRVVHSRAAHVAPSREHLTEETFETLGYLSGYKTAPSTVAVTVNDAARTSSGYNLFTSGDAPRAVLMDMEGHVLTTWSCDFRRAFPNITPPESVKSWQWWSCVHLDPNGELIAVFDGFGMVKLDKNSNVLWAVPGAFHHDLSIAADQRIYCLTREEKVIPRIHKHEPVLEDFVNILSPRGQPVESISLLDAFEKSSYAPLLKSMPHHGDLLHANTIEVLDGAQKSRVPAFASGNVLLSSATTNVVAVLDMKREEIVWALSGQWVRQHRPTLLDDGDILLVDNLGLGDRSRVLEVDPTTQEIVWHYEGTQQDPFFTETFGTLQRLPNGNTLINESNSGRAFEVDREHEIVWEFFNPARAGERHELIATLFEFERLPSDFPLDWLARAPQHTAH